MKDYLYPLKEAITAALESCYEYKTHPDQISIQPTKKEFSGTHTLVVFPFLKVSNKKAEDTAVDLGLYLSTKSPYVESFNVVKGFLNLSLSQSFWWHVFSEVILDPDFGHSNKTNKTFIVEYSSPNTNKPLHLGHLRNIFLGYSVAEILKATGNTVVKTQIINDRGIHICKSMVAWQKFGQGETPQSSQIKGDKFVGKYYVLFDKEYKSQIEQLTSKGNSEETARAKAPILLEAQDMLRKWEANDPEVYGLWQQMNGWVYQGFNKTYETLGVDFDKLYYESDTYLLGKNIIKEGLEKGIFYKKEDNSVWVDLTEDGLDHKLVLRADGTAVYITQDIGTASLRYQDYPDMDGMIYTVGNEQDYHFKVLFLILKKLGYSWAEGCFHLSYGMVDLPSGKMKSREGTVVDADDLVNEMISTAKVRTQELGKIEGLSEAEAQNLYRVIGLGALKYFILKVDPKKRMLFDPNESIDFQGNTGPFIQYAHARISAIKRRAKVLGLDIDQGGYEQVHLSREEIDLIDLIACYPLKLSQAASEYSPSVLAQYAYEVVKAYNRFYTGHSILAAENNAQVGFRVGLSLAVAGVINKTLSLLGIEAPERM